MTSLRQYSPFRFFQHVRAIREQELEQTGSNRFLAEALEQEKHAGHRIGVIARTVALIVVALFIPFLNPRLNVLYYEFFLMVFIGIGWLQYRMARVGYSRLELALIFLDLALMTLILVVPNPFMDDEIPTAFVYRFDSFIYFFIFLAVGTLAYSWRTVWAMGIWVTVLWLVGLIGVVGIGHRIPDLTEATQMAFAGYPILIDELDPNSARPYIRIQEVVVFLIVAGILAVKGMRSNQLLMKQASIAAERANLSRYFPSSLVDVLASTDHDVGAVRSQDVAVLFTDIVGFTHFAEQNSPEDVMDLLRQYHAIVERGIFQNQGTLDKYLGDGVMATFGTPETTPDDAANALKAALQIMNDVKAVNAERLANGQEAVEVSIGVHFGPVILGDIGPSRRLEFAVLGDTVNVASRLEATTRQLGCKCVVSQDLMDRANQAKEREQDEDNGFTQKGPLQLRGRQTPIDVWIA